jgi:hypothetical protein
LGNAFVGAPLVGAQNLGAGHAPARPVGIADTGRAQNHPMLLPCDVFRRMLPVDRKCKTKIPSDIRNPPWRDC